MKKNTYEIKVSNFNTCTGYRVQNEELTIFTMQILKWWESGQNNPLCKCQKRVFDTLDPGIEWNSAKIYKYLQHCMLGRGLVLLNYFKHFQN